MKKNIMYSLFLFCLFIPQAFAKNGLTALTVSDGAIGKEYSVTLEILILMTVLSFLPAILITLTSFTRIIIVMSILRQAIGLQQTPSNQILIGLSLFLTFFVMSPVMKDVYETAAKPYIDEKVNIMEAIDLAKKPLSKFMVFQTRLKDLNTFAMLAGYDNIEDINKTPMDVLIPAFVTSELKTAFQIGFILFIPFLVLDLLVASILMAMGMMMLSPMIVSLPFKIMLFVLVDGWNLVMGTLARSFGL